MSERREKQVSRSPLSREDVERGLRECRTKRDFDVIVACYRRTGAFEAADRDALDALADELVQRFGSAVSRARGGKVTVGRNQFNFRTGGSR